MINNLIITIGSAITILVTYILMFIFYHKMYDPRKCGYVKRIAVYSSTIIGMILTHMIGNPMINFLYLIVSAQAVSLILYKNKFRKTILYNMLYCTITTLCDMLTVIVMTIVTPQYIEQSLSNAKSMILSNLMYCMIVFAVYKIYIFVLTSKEQTTLRINELLFLILMTIFEFLAIYCITCSSASQVNGIMLIVLIAGFLLLNIYISYVLNLVAVQYNNKYEIDSVKKQNQLQLIHYEALNKKYMETQCMIHDIEKHISAIEHLKDNQNIQETQNYTAYIRQEIKKYKPAFNCKNKILSVILSQKIIEAEAENITVMTEVEDLSLNFIETADITSIFANLWDNAIEGCKSSGVSNKTILFKMCKIGNFIYVDMSNSFNGNLKMSKGKIISSKKNHKGLGLISIQMSVEKYGGFIINEQNGNEFLSEVVIPTIQEPVLT